MIPAGDYNQRITLQAPVDARGANGEVTTTWSTGTAMWAKVTSPRGTEKVAAMQAQFVVDLIVRIRWRDGVTNRHRILWRGRPYAVTGLSDAGPSGGYIEMQCTSGVEGAN